MAAIFQTPKFLFLLTLFTISSIVPHSHSQSNSPQNIQTFYPSPQPPPPVTVLSPPPRIDGPYNIPPPATLIQPPSPPTRSSTGVAVGRAIGITAASTLVVSGVLFFLLLRRSRRKRKIDDEAGVIATGNIPVVPPQNDNFVRVDGNVKGLIVDENGLDVLYWRKLEEGDKRRSFNKQYYKNLKDEEIEENRVIRDSLPVQEAPLLRGKSSTSQSPSWGDKEQVVLKKEPKLTSAISFKIEKQASSVQLMRMSTPPLPPPPGAPPPTSRVVESIPKTKMAAPPPPPSQIMEAIPKGKMAAPPPPPPILSNKGPAPPPPPPIPSNKGPAPPPPPPIPSNKGPAPPPPPPGVNASASSFKPPTPKGMPNKRSSSAGEGTSSKGNEQVKLKPLHWDKVNPNVEHSMVWDKIDKGSFKFDGDLMEALFGYVATNRKSPQRDSRSSTPIAENKSGPPSPIFILETHKSQNTAIVLKSIGISRNEIIHSLMEGHGLNADTIEKLTRIAPTDEESSQILAFNGDPTRLADAESFLYHLLKTVPSAFSRFNAMLFRLNYDFEVSHVKESLKSLESACNELRTRGLFLKLLEAVLKAGNRLNAGTSRGNAQAFNLTALRKLSDVKSSDGKTTLLQFVIQEVVRAEGKRCVLNKSRSLSRANSQSGSQSSDGLISKDDREKEYMMLGLPVIGGLSSEFSNVKKAAVIDYDLLVKTISSLAAQVVEIWKIVAGCGPDGGFAREMNGFLNTVELEMDVVKEEQTRVMDLVKKTMEYYQAGSSKDKSGNLLQLFVIVRDFLGMVDQVCIDIARNVQKRRPVASSPVAGSSSPESPRVFRFPKLPANFMSDDSKSSSSDSDDDNDSDERI